MILHHHGRSVSIHGGIIDVASTRRGLVSTTVVATAGVVATTGVVVGVDHERVSITVSKGLELTVLL